MIKEKSFYIKKDLKWLYNLKNHDIAWCFSHEAFNKLLVVVTPDLRKKHKLDMVSSRAMPADKLSEFEALLKHYNRWRGKNGMLEEGSRIAILHHGEPVAIRLIEKHHKKYFTDSKGYKWDYEGHLVPKERWPSYRCETATVEHIEALRLKQKKIKCQSIKFEILSEDILDKIIEIVYPKDAE